MARLFGTDGVRGVANQDLTAELAMALGAAAARRLNRIDPTRRRVAVVGRDPRASGEMLEAAVVAGVSSEGVDTLLVGVLPTPAVAYLTSAYDADFGVMISASHNPMPDNGIKIFGPGGHKLDDDTEDRIEELVRQGPGARPTGAGIGRVDRRRGRVGALPAPRRQGDDRPARSAHRRGGLRARRGVRGSSPRLPGGRRQRHPDPRRAGRAEHQRGLRVHPHAVTAFGRGVLRRRPGPGTRWRRRPLPGGRRPRPGRRRGRDHGGAGHGHAGDRRTRRPDAGRHRDEQPGPAPGDAVGRDRGPHHRRRRPVRPGGAARRGIRAGWGAVRAHRVARLRHHRRRHRHRAAVDVADGADPAQPRRSRRADADVAAGADQRAR